MRYRGRIFSCGFVLLLVSVASAWPPPDPLARPATTEPAPMRIPHGTKVISDIVYAQASPAEVLDLYLPVTRPDAPMPVIVYFHGGGWHFGDKSHPSAIVPFV